MADQPPPAKIQKLDTTTALPECPYGARCYRKNPQHFKEFSHTGSSSDASIDATSASPTLKSTIDVVVSSVVLPACKYGIKCYRKNLLHFAEFSHPTSSSSKSGNDDGSDTDIYDSDDGEKADEKTETDKKNNLLKGMSLVKRFSMMTDQERKELIQTALEEKLRLQQELDGAKKIVAEKNKELVHLQKQMTSGLLMLDGEEEALKKTETTYFPLMPERAYKEGSASQIHFRLAESQFYRLVTGDSANLEYQSKLKKERGETLSYPVLGFHGTDEKNIKLICELGFKTPGDSGFHHKTDTGYYGAGVYFSEYPSYSMGYIRGGSKLMLCQVLAGKVYECKTLIMGASLVKGYDSHMSPCKKELVIFNSAAILPCYIIYFTNAKAAFSYDMAGSKKHVVDGGGAGGAGVGGGKFTTGPGSKVFKGMTFALTGTLSDTHENIFALIYKHGGGQGTKAKFDMLVASDDETMEDSAKLKQARKKTIPVVCEAYLYDCIEKKKKLPITEYEIGA